MQFRGPEFYKETEGANRKESYLFGIFRTSALNKQNFSSHLLCILMRTFFRKHGKWCLKDRQEHLVLMIDVPMQVHESSHPVIRYDAAQRRCAKSSANHTLRCMYCLAIMGAMAMQWQWCREFHQQAKTANCLTSVIFSFLLCYMQCHVEYDRDILIM